MLTTYGSGLLVGRQPLGYADWVGLFLNLDRLQRRQAVAVAEGMVTGSGTSDLDSSWADAVAQWPEEVPPIHFGINAERQSARIRARLGFPRE